jgi:hypothetical protein
MKKALELHFKFYNWLLNNKIQKTIVLSFIVSMLVFLWSVLNLNVDCTPGTGHLC